MKKTTKLGVKKVTLRNLDETKLNAMAAAASEGTFSVCIHVTCAGQKTCNG
ncbi:MAG: hypothetical protein ABR874_05195 [Candidatus Sulfotelmatobacter sp.]